MPTFTPHGRTKFVDMPYRADVFIQNMGNVIILVYSILFALYKASQILFVLRILNIHCSLGEKSKQCDSRQHVYLMISGIPLINIRLATCRIYSYTQSVDSFGHSVSPSIVDLMP